MNGLELIKHTAGGGVMTATTTGGSVDLVKNGKIEFTNATEVHINKCFDVPVNPGDEPLYDNYLVVTRFTGSATRARLRFRANGVDVTTRYEEQQLRADDTIKASRGSNVGSFNFDFGGDNFGHHIWFYGPNLAQPSAFRNVGVNAGGGAGIQDIAGTHPDLTRWDGFMFYPTGNPITGSLTIYGFTKGQTP